MMGYPTEYKLLAVCQICGGDGEIHDQNSTEGNPATIPCETCSGTGIITTRYTIDGLVEMVTEMENQLDQIEAEQASQRTDLTAALTQIWNKVKNL